MSLLLASHLAPVLVKPSQVNFSIQDLEAVLTGTEEQDVFEVLDYSLFTVKLTKVPCSASVKLIMTCCITSKGTRVRHIIKCAGD
jgi:hypothetical protein